MNKISQIHIPDPNSDEDIDSLMLPVTVTVMAGSADKSGVVDYDSRLCQPLGQTLPVSVTNISAAYPTLTPAPTVNSR